MTYLQSGGQVDMDQDKITGSLFGSILTLKKAIGENNVLQIIHPGKIWMASFQWNSPATKQSVTEIEDQLSLHLPDEFAIFLTNISDGAVLYYDLNYGQWGYKIYSSLEIVTSQMRWRRLFRESWIKDFVAIGEIIDESHPIILNHKNLSSDKLSAPLLEGNALDPVDYWPKMSSTLHAWFDHLITAQGAKFWDWK
jgi:hypothetical protein